MDRMRFALCDDSDIERRIIRFLLDKYIEEHGYLVEVEAFRYLVKPISEEKLFQSLDKFFLLHSAMQVLEYKYQRTVRKMLIKDVLWIEAAGRHAIIHTEKEMIESTTNLSEFANKLSGADFVKPIRYALVQLQAVAEVTHDTMVLKDGTRIPISRECRKEIQEAFIHRRCVKAEVSDGLSNRRQMGE